MSATPLNQVLAQLSNEPDARTAFEADPAGFLANSGHAGLEPSDLQEALGVMAEGTPTVEAAGLMETATLIDSAFVDLDAAPVDDIDFGAGSGDSAEPPAFDEPEDESDALAEFDALEDLDTDLGPTVEPDPDGTDDFGFGHGDLDVNEEEAPDDLDALEG